MTSPTSAPQLVGGTWLSGSICTADGGRLGQGRLSLARRVGRIYKAKDVVEVQEELTSVYPAPTLVRSDNGPEFITQAHVDWYEARATTSTDYIEAGSAWKDGFAESLKAWFRVDAINNEVFTVAPVPRQLAEAEAENTTIEDAFGPLEAYSPRGSTAGMRGKPLQPTLIRKGAIKGLTSRIYGGELLHPCQRIYRNSRS